MSARWEREPREVGPVYVICSLCATHTHTHAQKSEEGGREWGDEILFEDGCHILTMTLPHTGHSESRAFRSHCFYHHVCEESALVIIYGFKNTDIVHFTCFQTCSRAFWAISMLKWKWRQNRIRRLWLVMMSKLLYVYVSVCVCVFTQT